MDKNFTCSEVISPFPSISFIILPLMCGTPGIDFCVCVCIKSKSLLENSLSRQAV